MPITAVEQKLREIRGIQWWIDHQIAAGKSDEEIAAELPAAVAFITGRISLAALIPS